MNPVRARITVAAAVAAEVVAVAAEAVAVAVEAVAVAAEVVPGKQYPGKKEFNHARDVTGKGSWSLKTAKRPNYLVIMYTDMPPGCTLQAEIAGFFALLLRLPAHNFSIPCMRIKLQDSIPFDD